MTGQWIVKQRKDSVLKRVRQCFIYVENGIEKTQRWADKPIVNVKSKYPPIPENLTKVTKIVTLTEVKSKPKSTPTKTEKQKPKQSVHRATPEQDRQLMKDILLNVHSSFCTDTKDIYQGHKISRDKAFTMLRKLENAGLVTHEEQEEDECGNRSPSRSGRGSKSVSWAWQMGPYLNIDYKKPEEIEKLFEEKFPKKKGK